MSARMQGRRVVVVGATGGIGTAITKVLLDDGIRVIGTGRSARGLEDVAALGAIPVALALEDPQQAGAIMAEAVADAFAGELDGIVVASGNYGPIGPTRTVDITSVEHTFMLNLLAPLALIQAVAPALDAGVEASVVFLSGGGATDSFPNYSAYAISKVATVRLVENLALEEPGWKVNAIAPGFVATAIHDATRAAGDTASAGFLSRTDEMTARAVDPAIAARLTAFLLSPQSRRITGRLISAVWDPWEEPAGQALLSDDPHFGRLRRIDRQFFSAMDRDA